MSDVITQAADFLRVLDLASAVVFAITGALVASRKQMDIVGFLWLGVVTGVGGGTVRDLLLGAPVFWVVDATPLALCLAAAAIVHFSAHLVASRYRILLYLDAFGMALVTTVGTAKALDMGTGPLVAVGMGVITAAVGGILRDLLGQEPSILLRRDIYVTAAAFGSIALLVADGLGLSRLAATGIAIGIGFGVRAGAVRFDLYLPVFRPRPGRIPGRRGEVE
ncbi:trimeric intracellular cation channel family protein [Pseudotabrizicola algicola]|uniref:Trimeric intracellular cation channel family protein n=1 Tax=Pseudotabrizicola algicola TaxID=2709381 RepID=A0A6B3S062_9RHOB|nr:trimeric intracellular cation channel family protein [Pseudotabrizicola algicola]NEX48719.1 trimeric intracellular cation channel family protein [Pseudotabrizicola algicola]